MKGNGSTGRENLPKIRIEGPLRESHEDESVWREVHKFSKLVPSEAEPNFGRLQEIKEEIKKGTYLNKEMIEETAARLAIRFMTRE